MATLSLPQRAPQRQELRWQILAGVERCAAGALLAGVAAPLAGLALLIAALSRRPPLIPHRRVGYLGQDLWVLKLRTMWDASAPGRRGLIERIQDEAGPNDKRPGDARVTSAVAAFCRRHSIDELPQLWHVLRGEMLLIGPRPLTADELRAHYGADTGELLSVKPGMAGLWQTSGRNRLTYPERRTLDLHFVRHRSAGMYLRIVRGAAKEILSGANTW